MRQRIVSLQALFVGLVGSIMMATIGMVGTAYAASTCTWIGSGSGTWSSAANWSSCNGGVPQNGDSVTFDNSGLASTSDGLTTNDLTGLQLNSISFSGSSIFGYSVSGNAITLTSVSDTSTSAPNTLGTNITAGGNMTINNSGGLSIGINSSSTLSLGSNSLTVSGTSTTHIRSTVSGSGPINFGGNISFLDANNTGYSGTVNINNGRLIFNANQPSALGTGTVTVASGATLQESFNTSATYSFTNPLVLAGSGVSGVGAVYLQDFTGTGTSNLTFSGGITLTGNAQFGLTDANATIASALNGCYSVTTTSASNGSLSGPTTGSCATQIPSLSSPVSGTAYASLPISFNLPQSPGAGTVRLTFIGPVTRTVTLTTSSAGSTSFSLNPANLATNTAVQSVTPAGNLPDGIYSLTLSYQNSGFNPAASTTVNNVIIDSNVAAGSGTTATAATPQTTSTPAATTVASTPSQLANSGSNIVVTLAIACALIMLATGVRLLPVDRKKL